MPRLGLIDQQELLRWANTVSARSDFPRLIRRLILETGRGVVQLGFPAGEGVSAGSWDGTVRSTEATAFIPLGLSLWELSVEKSVGRKADADYNKRTATPDGSPTTECTYVAASIRRWRERQNWARTHAADGRWKTVRAYGVDDIETWLDTAPVTHAWISERLGHAPHGLVPADTWWEDWSQATTPVIPFELVLAGEGRAKAATAFKARLAQPPQIITIKAQSTDDVLAFAAAVACQERATDGGYLLSRMAFIDDVASWRSLRDHQTPLVLLARTDEVRAEVAVGSTHHLVVPIIGAAEPDIELPPIDVSDATEALRQAGLDERRAREAGPLARRSLRAMRRRLAIKPELHQPTWARPPVQRTVRRLLLASQWSDRRPGDQAIVAALVGEDYANVREELAALSEEADPLVERVDQSWTLISSFDAWLLIGGQLRDDDLQRLEPAVRTVLTEVDPSLELSRPDRLLASMRGQVPDHSDDLRHGLATSLALLGARGHQVDLGGGSTGATLANYLVWIVLEQANQDRSCQLWASLSDVLPLLAEGAPDAFLNEVRDGVGGSEPLLIGMFTDADTDSLSASSPHSGLLWALEGVAWSPDHFGQAVNLLARLAEIDPGGKLANRPQKSLADIFCPWHPENSVSVTRRLAAIDGIRRNHPAVSWPLMLDLLPELQAIHLPTREPAYRDWKPPKVRVTVQEYWTFIDEIVRRILQDAAISAERWRSLIEKLSHLHPPGREQVRQTLSRLIDAERFDAETRLQVWESLRDLVARHREFAEADWSLATDEVDALDSIVIRLAPDDAAHRHAWLFNDWLPELGDFHLRDDMAAYDRALTERRAGAISEVEKTSGLEGVIALARSVELPWAVGIALADAATAKYDDYLLGLAESNDNFDRQLALPYLARRFEQSGWPWVESLIGEGSTLTTLQRGLILVRTHDFPKAWEVADDQGEGVAEVFWRHFPTSGLGTDFGHAEYATGRLLTVGRAAAALRLIGLYVRRGQPNQTEAAKLVATALEAILSANTPDPEMRAILPFELQQLFSFLQQRKADVGWERVARLEWAYLTALGLDARTDTLHELMATDPSFFVDVVKAVYPPRSGDETLTPAPEREQMASNGYRLLSNWSQVPGTDSSGAIDGAALRQWITRTVGLLEEADRLRVGQVHIGQVLASSPPDPDGRWPGLEVRNLLEELQSDQVEKGLANGIIGTRFTTRAPDEGGRQEWELVDKYRQQAEQFTDEWPRTASVLRSVANHYESLARREDEAAERFRRGLER
jgi:hypothetical protein